METLATCMAEVAAGAPVLLYHIPHLTNACFNMLDFLRVAAEWIPTSADTKYTGTNLHEMQAFLELADDSHDHFT